ncbi:caspase family protein [Microtetraspora sp. NBRC 16547]|uniref:caspase family protein n=1 Tax=Microtetraspora sp. NBRC 16547 TaxID=3030993 RepID=UPI0024A04ED2|nr:caspase family protein [Microtetraspora sp. NBRC 16547]GLW98193.1 hypothetical protein Misp02_22800 [Microtetraspora sp. NBRC 16547]
MTVSIYGGMDPLIFNQGRALIVGVADYPGNHALPDAVLNDARDTAAVLQAPEYCGFPPDNVRLLVDGEATLDALRTELGELASSARPDDTVIIFFSGHGGRFDHGGAETSALIPVDFRDDNMQGTTLLEAEFSTALAAIQARRLLVLLDACHSGGASTLKGGRAGNLRPGFDEKSLQRLAQGTGRVVIASSRATEFSYALPGARNSIFTECLLQALRGGAHTRGDGLIRVFDLFNHISGHVPQAHPDQHPVLKATDVEDDFPIALDLGGRKAVAGATPVPLDRWRELEATMADLYPAGPADQDIWLRSGGDLSRLRLAGTGRATWFSALRTLQRGGGGPQISIGTLVATALDDFPHHQELASWLP